MGKGKSAKRGSGQKKTKSLAADLSELFTMLRSGAANVAGVSYQVALSAMLLAAGRAGTVAGLPVRAVIPENLEDVDCQLADGARLLVQSKERGPGAAAIANAELAEIAAHAAQALKLSDESGANGRETPRARLAVVTNGSFGSSLPVTGWTQTLDEALTAQPSGTVVRQNLLTALRAKLKDLGLETDLAPMVVERTHLVHQDGPASATASLMEAGLGLHPALADLLRARLFSDLSDVAARQRQSTFDAAETRTVNDLDAMAAQLMQEVSVESLEEALRAGVCAPLNFLTPSGEDARVFFAGVSVAPGHIAAGLDVVRPHECRQVLDGLAERGHVVITGPSGSGKSALLWRCARLVEAGPRLLQVLRVETADDVELLVRHVQRARPSGENRIVVCIDDVGRARTGAWADARDRLLALPGVTIMAAARQEDLTPALSRGAVLVDAALTSSAAREVYEAVQASGTPVQMAQEEAVARAEGLLMEFLALVTTGRRLRDVLAEQVARFDEAQRDVEREVLRLVCAAHALGFETSAEALPSALERPRAEIERALHRLVGEHMLLGTGDGGLRGLHDLRTEVLLELLHEHGLPPLGSTFAAAVLALAPASRPQALRRAATWVARACTRGLEAVDATAQLTRVRFALKPLASCIAAQLHELAGAMPGAPQEGSAALRAAALLEVADRLDTIAHVYASLLLADAVRPPHVDRVMLLRLAWMSLDGMDISGLPPNPIQVLAPLLPQRSQQAGQAAGAAVGPDGLVRLLAAAPLADAVRLAEAAETLVFLTAEQASEVYRHLVPALPHPPGSDPGIPADLRAQLTASLASLAGLRGAEVAAAFGDVTQRAVDAVASDPYGRDVEVSFMPTGELRATAGDSLARPWTYSPALACTARMVSYARRPETPAPASAYAPEKDGDPQAENAQVVRLMRRLFDACPEVDLIHAELWQANDRPQQIQGVTDGVKTILAGVLRRSPATGRHVALRAVAVEADHNESWTRRCRAQAELVLDLLALFEKLPSRLRPRDMVPAREEWTAKVKRVHEAAVALPPRPADPAARLSPAEAEMVTYAAADDDASLLEAAEQDAAKKALAHLASCLSQVANSAGDAQGLRGAGSRLLDAVPDLERAREQGAPVYSGIGDTLPVELITVVARAAKLLSAVDEPAVVRALGRGLGGRGQLEAAVDVALEQVLQTTLQAVSEVLGRVGITVNGSAFVEEPTPLAPWLDRQVVVAVPVEQWPQVQEALRAWTSEQRCSTGVRCRIACVPVEDSEVLPFGSSVLPYGDVWPLEEDHLNALADGLGLQMRGRAVQAALTQPVLDLRAYSYDLVRRARRPQEWDPDPEHPTPPAQIAAAFACNQADILAQQEDPQALPLRDQYRLIAVRTLLEVCDLVAAEDGHRPGLAAGLAALDVANPQISQEYPAVARLDFALTAAIEADHDQPPPD
ncbi:P-loop NTPase family protein [Streptomyces griseoluteus]|uniref:hypothetical protein n=1 Tax=Streptomyces griseoluteus TaxID=29306 RepID=UPI0036C5E6F4